MYVDVERKNHTEVKHSHDIRHAANNLGKKVISVSVFCTLNVIIDKITIFIFIRQTNDYEL